MAQPKEWYEYLDWRHYLVAGLILAVLLGSVILLIISSSSDSVDKPSKENAPVETPQTTTAAKSPGIGDPIGNLFGGTIFGSTWFWLLLPIPMMFILFRGIFREL